MGIIDKPILPAAEKASLLAEKDRLLQVAAAATIGTRTEGAEHLETDYFGEVVAL